MANQEILMRYKRSMIGPFWISLSMTAMILGVGLVFSEIQQVPYAEYLAYFGCGMLVWMLVSTIVIDSTMVVMESESQLRNIPLPIPMLASKSVYRNFVIFAHNALVVGVMLAILRTPIDFSVAYQAVFALPVYAGCGLFLGIIMGPICARFRDLSQLVASVVQIAFFLTPVFWKAGSEFSRPVILELNPFWHLIEIFRAPLMGNEALAMNWIASLSILAGLGVLAVVTLAVTRRSIYLWL